MISVNLYYTQQELADKIGYALAAQISFIEHGKRGISRSKAIEFCNVFNISIDELFFDIDIKDKKNDIYLDYTESKESDIIKKFIFLCNSSKKHVNFDSIKSLISSMYCDIKQSQNICEK